MLRSKLNAGSSPLTKDGSRLLACVTGAAVGLALALAILPVEFIAGNSGFWKQPKHDFFAYLIAWHYFLPDRWRFPLLDVPAMGYPEGGNLIYSDGLPVAQLLSKAAHTAFGWSINPLGWWILITYLLQGALAARLVLAAGVRTPLGWIAAAILATACVPFMTRIFHVALSSHFVLLWALALYFENIRARRFGGLEHFSLSALTLLINAYLFVMVGFVQAVTVATLWWRERIQPRQLVRIAIGVALVFAIGIIIGYGRFVADPGTMRASGFGIHSWNPTTLVLAPPGHWDYLPIVRIASLEQAEGESYLGLGALFVVAVVCVTRPRAAMRAVNQHRLLVILFVLFLLYAASNRIFVGARLLVEVPLPSLVDKLVGLFRASGRFVWVPGYALVVLSIAAALKWLPRRAALTVITLACALQLSEVGSTVQTFRPVLASPSENLLNVDQMRRWLSQHQRLFQFPSFSCQPPRTADETFREFQIELLAARLNVPNNSIYTARQLKNCGLEAVTMFKGNMDDGTLYVLKKGVLEQAPALVTLAQSPFCVDLEWALVCSRQPLRR